MMINLHHHCLLLFAVTTNRRSSPLLRIKSSSSHPLLLRRLALFSCMSEELQYFLLKSEPKVFSIQDLETNPGSVEEWDGVRNFEARNVMRSMKIGDKAFFYHSSCRDAGIVGTVTISREAQPDVTAYQDPNHDGYDPKSTKDNCRWDSVQVRLESIYPALITLKELKAQAQSSDVIAGMNLLRRSRLSVSKVTPEEWAAVEQLLERKLGGEELLSTGVKKEKI